MTLGGAWGLLHRVRWDTLDGARLERVLDILLEGTGASVAISLRMMEGCSGAADIRVGELLADHLRPELVIEPRLPRGRGDDGQLSLPARLTPGQLRELKKLGDGPQMTYGSGRTRIQNNLVWMGLADYVDDDGKPVTRGVFFSDRSALAAHCVITDAGRRWLSGDR